MHGLCCGGHPRRREARGIDTRNCLLNLSKCLAGGESVQKCRVRSCCILEQAGGFFRSEIVAYNRKGVENWRIPVKGIIDRAGHWIIEEADPATKNRIVRHTERLPRKTKARSPQNAVHALQGMFLVNQNRLIIGLVGVVANGFEWSRKTRKAAVSTNRIRIVFRAKSCGKSEICPRVPLLLAVESETQE